MKSHICQLRTKEYKLYLPDKKLLKEKLPASYGIIVSHDKEMANHTLAELPYLFFLGGTPDTVLPVTEKIFAMKRW